MLTQDSTPITDCPLVKTTGTTSMTDHQQCDANGSSPMRMQVRVIPGRQLTTDLVQRWSELQRGNPGLQSPYFRPEFTQIVADVRGDVEVAVIEANSIPQAFLPFQRGALGAAQPVAGRLSDFHNWIAAPGFQFDPQELLAQCGLRSFRFDHLLHGADCFQPYIFQHSASPYLDLSQGFPHYEANRRADNSEMATIKRKLGKMAREVGPLRLEWSCDCKTALQQLQQWKGEQYVRTGNVDLFTIDWIRQMFDRLLQNATPELGGKLTGLYAGDKLVAAHLGLASAEVLHWWFPAYDRELGRYSPGLVLIYMMAQQANDFGIKRIDLGKGDEEYKFRIATHVDQVAEGCVDAMRTRQLLRRSWRMARDWVRNSPLRSTARIPYRMLKRVRDWFKFQ
jgi:CelD/BcsL family acetyltransferase involved in cellulose biosynthesis